MQLDLVVERDCEATTPDGVVIKTTVGVTRPTRVKEWSWSITTTLGSISPSQPSFVGVDSWHAIQAGMQDIFDHLTTLENNGWKFRWLDGSEDDLRSLLPQKGRETP